MATLTTQPIDADGLTPTYAACAAGGDKVTPGDHTFIHVKNASVGSINVTIATPGVVAGDLAIGDRVVAVGAGSEKMIPVPEDPYEQPSDGLAWITYSAVTTLTIAVLSA